MLLCIDFQPAYEEAFADFLDPLRIRLQEASRTGEEVHFIYNDVLSLEGEELGDSPERLLEWAAARDLPLQGARMIGKNFGWVSHLFRSGTERKVAISLLRSLIQGGYAGSHEIAAAEQERIVATSHDHFPGFWDCSPEGWQEIRTGAIAMPYRFDGGMMDWLESLKTSGEDPVEVTGGYRERCLDEICMMLEAYGVPFRANDSLIYGLPEEFPEVPEPADPLLRVCESISPLLFPLKSGVLAPV